MAFLFLIFYFLRQKSETSNQWFKLFYGVKQKLKPWSMMLLKYELSYCHDFYMMFFLWGAGEKEMFFFMHAFLIFYFLRQKSETSNQWFKLFYGVKQKLKPWSMMLLKYELSYCHDFYMMFFYGGRGKKKCIFFMHALYLR